MFAGGNIIFRAILSLEQLQIINDVLNNFFKLKKMQKTKKEVLIFLQETSFNLFFRCEFKCKKAVWKEVERVVDNVEE